MRKVLTIPWDKNQRVFVTIELICIQAHVYSVCVYIVH